MTAAGTKEKTWRRDAQRNRDRIVASARVLFAREGIDASVEDITRHAGVGMGTLYRHFSTKEELVDAVLEDALSDYVALAEQALAEEDAWTGFTFFLERAVGLHAANRGLKDVVATHEHGLKHVRAMRARTRPLLRRLVERAQEAGTLRPDFTVEDMPLLFWTSGRVIEVTSSVAPDYWRRYLGLILDGLRAEAATPLPQPPLSEAQLKRAARGRG
jgi:AcrR family transcriptional regulator